MVEQVTETHQNDSPRASEANVKFLRHTPLPLVGRVMVKILAVVGIIARIELRPLKLLAKREPSLSEGDTWPQRCVPAAC